MLRRKKFDYVVIIAIVATVALLWVLSVQLMGVQARTLPDTFEDKPPTVTAIPADALILANGTIIDGTGAEPISGSMIVIQENRILAIGPSADFIIPPDAEVINVAGRTIMPGIINAHVHNSYSPATRHRALVTGVTAVCDLGTPLRYISDFEQAYTKLNQPAARGFRAGPMITVPGGYPGIFSGISWHYEVSTPAEAEAAVLDLLDRGADMIKIALEPGYPEHPWPTLSLEQVQAIVSVAHAHGVPVRAHVRQAAGLDIALKTGVDVIEHVPVPFSLEADYRQTVETDLLHLAAQPAFEAQLAWMVEQGVVMVPTLDINVRVHHMLPGLAPEERQRLDDFLFEIVGRFQALGGVVALGNDYGTSDIPHGMPLREMELLLTAGLTPMEVIEAGTRNAAQVCGHGDELGTLEAGKLADIIVVDGNPLAAITAMSRVILIIKGGQIVDAGFEQLFSARIDH